MRYDVIIIGSQPAACVAAEACVQKGMQVYWSKGPKKAGGIFRGIQIENKIWDAGMNLLELSTFSTAYPKQDLKTYDAEKRYDAVRFIPELLKFFESKLQLHKVALPQMHMHQQLYPDFLISNQTECIRSIDSEIRHKIIQELIPLTDHNPLHASLKNTSLDFELLNYQEIAYANHGATFHSLYIQPWLEAICGNVSERIPGRYHRQIWAPLWYPETLIKLMRGEHVEMPETCFHYPLGERFGAWLERLEHSLFHHPKIHISLEHFEEIHREKEYWTIHRGADEIEGNYLFYCDDLNPLSATPAHIERGKIGFIAFEITHPEFDFSVINFVQAEYGIFRITNQTHLMGNNDPEVHQYMAEFGCDKPAEVEQIIILLTSLGLIRHSDQYRQVQLIPPVPAFPLPTFQNLELFRNLQQEILERFPGIQLGGSAGSLTSISLNEQIIQGLSFTEKVQHGNI